MGSARSEGGKDVAGGVVKREAGQKASEVKWVWLEGILSIVLVLVEGARVEVTDH